MNEELELFLKLAEHRAKKAYHNEMKDATLYVLGELQKEKEEVQE